MKYFLASILFVVISGCTTLVRIDPEFQRIDQTKLPAPDLNLTISGLGPCTENQNRSFQLNSQAPVVVMVHGCLGSAGRFRALAEVFAFSGQQAVCFSYNDRDSLLVSSGQLSASLEQLAARIESKEITVIGHSQGGLIARKALVANHADSQQQINTELKLITVSAPFSGIKAAGHCSSTLGRILSLGLTVPICMIASGDKWYEITGASEFINQPGELIQQVEAHLKINTDETGSCRRADVDNNCAEDDFVFSLGEQRNKAVDEGEKVINLDARAGHVEIVGDQRVAPVKLIAILQQQGVLKDPEPEQLAAFNELLTRLYW